MAGFPWDVFSANTLRPMIADILRSGGYSPSDRLNRESSITLLQNIEKHGRMSVLSSQDLNIYPCTVEAALKDTFDAPAKPNASVSAKRKHAEEEDKADPNDAASSSQPVRKRGRLSKQHAEEDNNNEADTSISVSRRRTRGGNAAETVSAPAAPSRSRGRNSDAAAPKSKPAEGLLTRRQVAAQTRGTAPPTRAGKPAAARAPRKAAPAKKKAAPEAVGALFDGVEIVTRPRSYGGKGKGKEREADGEEGDVGSDADAEGDEVDVEEPGTGTTTSTLENSNKENDVSLTELANADTDVDAESESAPFPAFEAQIGSPPPQITVDIIEATRPKGEDMLLPGVPEIGSPVPQIAIEPTDDQIEEARLNHDAMSIEVGSPAPEITIEPMAEDDGEEIEFEPADEVAVQIEGIGNGHIEEGGFLHARPRIAIPRAGTPLNPEYSIEVHSPGSAQHDSDDEMWVINGINGSRLQALDGGLGALD
ncbi:hypothetical protein B0H14DRAFT_2667805 [Mycena olivaceomarginata]|nr:hypothetical protein B0H14DRAFT_2667805 [Mycena olivaceomarginata]